MLFNLEEYASELLIANITVSVSGIIIYLLRKNFRKKPNVEPRSALERI